MLISTHTRGVLHARLIDLDSMTRLGEPFPREDDGTGRGIMHVKVTPDYAAPETLTAQTGDTRAC